MASWRSVLAQNESLGHRINTALIRAADYLAAKQSKDGAWRSEVYGMLKDGPSLTPLVMSALYFLPREGNVNRHAFPRGVKYLSGFVNADGKIDDAFAFPVYTAAAACWALQFVDDARSPARLRVQNAWLTYLRARQLDESNGWNESDEEFGGWGYAIGIPRKPTTVEERDPLLESNLSSTVYGLGALRAARVPMADPVYKKILRFVEQCQNFSNEPAKADHAFDDGGFFFAPNDPAKNKAGVAGTDRLGRRRFHSYGGMTADGVRALLHSGLAADHPRVVAARAWLVKNFSAEHNPGKFEPDREAIRDATYFYYCWSVAHAFMHLGNVREIDWTRALAEELLRRQRDDGSWSNRFTDTKEDDPLVATPQASAALAICARVLGYPE